MEALAASQGVPANYLVQILNGLKTQGIARSVRGKSGGYLLARPPEEITLGEVLRAADGTIFDAPALRDPACPPELKAAWQQLQQTVDAAADAVTFQQLLAEGAENQKMYDI